MYGVTYRVNGLSCFADTYALFCPLRCGWSWADLHKPNFKKNKKNPMALWFRRSILITITYTKLQTQRKLHNQEMTGAVKLNCNCQISSFKKNIALQWKRVILLCSVPSLITVNCLFFHWQLFIPFITSIFQRKLP